MAWFVGLAGVLLTLFSAGILVVSHRAAYRSLDDLLDSRTASLAALTECELDTLLCEFDPAPELTEPRDPEAPWRTVAVYRPKADGSLFPVFLSPGFPRELDRRAQELSSRARESSRHRFSLTAEVPGHGRARARVAIRHARVEGGDELGSRVPPGTAVTEARAVPPRESTRVPLLVVAAESTVAVEQGLRRLALVLLGSLPPAILLAGGLGWLLAARIARPIARMARVADRIRSSGKPDAVPVGGAGDEIDRLGNALNQAFARLRAALQRQQRFTGDAAHELRTPLAVIRSQSEVALRGARSEAEYREVLAAILAAATRAGETLDGLLFLARADLEKTPHRPSPVDIAGLCEAVAESLAPDARSREQTVSVTANRPALVTGDAKLLRIAIENTIRNAIQHGLARGRIEIRVLRKEDTIRIEIEDDGPGIPDRHIEHVCEPFYRVDSARSRAHGGSGLGLSIVRSIVERHQGRLTLRSVVGSGTCVALELPAHTSP